MYHSTQMPSPVGILTLAATDAALAGMWIDGQAYEGPAQPERFVRSDAHPILCEGRRWLERYFAGERPCASELPLEQDGNAFRQTVWSILAEIPYGQVTTYGVVAAETARRLGKPRMSAQAVGGAVGHNQLAIIIPCHRVIGANGNLTGYGGGLNMKIALLRHEGVDLSRLYVPGHKNQKIGP